MLSPDLQRLEHIRDYCRKIQKSLLRHGNSEKEFNTDEEFQQAVAFSVLQIGELCNGLSEEYRRSTSGQVQWNAIRGLRNIIVHAYGSIKLNILWTVVTTDFQFSSVRHSRCPAQLLSRSLLWKSQFDFVFLVA